MNAFVLVFNHPFFDVTDADGRFRIEQRAARHLHRGRLVRGRGAHLAAGDRAARRRPSISSWSCRDGGALGSLTNRIFLASTLLAMVSIGFAVYFVSSRMTSETEAELQRDLREAATLVDQQRATLFDTFTRTARLIADLPKFKAVGRDARCADGRADRARLSAAGRRGFVPRDRSRRARAGRRSAGRRRWSSQLDRRAGDRALGRQAAP